MEKVPRIPSIGPELEVKEEYSSNLDDVYLYKLAGRDDVIIRPLDWLYHMGRGHFQPTWERKKISAEEFAAISKKHFDELASYGVNVPVSFFVADRKDKNSEAVEVFAVVDDIKKNKEASLEARGRAFCALRKSLLRYYAQKFNRGGSFLADLAEDTQYVYGKKKGDETDKLYLVDVEPFIYKDLKTFEKVIAMNLRAAEAERSNYKMAEYDHIIRGFEALHRNVEAKL